MQNLTACRCKLITYLIGVTAVSFATFGAGTGSIWLDNVQCVGTETRLIDCPANAIGSHNCVHSEDAGVRCGTSVVGKCVMSGISHSFII